MNILDAFAKLDAITEPLVESAATDDFKKLLDEINQLNQNIKVLQSQKAKEWDTEYSKKFEKEAEELNKLKKELSDLRQSYQDYLYTEVEDDGDRYYYNKIYKDNPERKAAAAEKEAALETRLKELETRYNRIVNELRAEQDLKFAKLSSKTNELSTKQSQKDLAFKTIIEEELPELEKLVEKIQEYVNITPDWKRITYNKGRIYFTLKNSKPFNYEVSYWEAIDEDKMEELALENEFIYDVAFSLGISEDIIDNLNKSNLGEVLEIPGSSWKFLFDFDVEYDEPDEDVSSISWDINCYLVKEL